MSGGTPRVPKPSHLPGHAAQDFPSLWAPWGRSSLQLLSQQTACAQGVTHLLQPVSITAERLRVLVPAQTAPTYPKGPPRVLSLGAAAMSSWEHHEDTQEPESRTWEATRRGTFVQCRDMAL